VGVVSLDPIPEGSAPRPSGRRGKWRDVGSGAGAAWAAAHPPLLHGGSTGAKKCPFAM